MAGIYIHIPFCKQACHYCNFHFSTSLKLKNDLIDALLLEIEMQRNYFEDEKIETIYFGGGTPSLLSAEELNQIIEKINQNFSLASDIECTIEANPYDLDPQKIKNYKTLTPINRFSLGVQSFMQADLEYMNRAHNSTQATDSIKMIQDAGFDNISIDLIYGTPTLSDENWLLNLHQTFQFEIPHISAYALTVEPNTALDHMIKQGKSEVVSDEKSRDQMILLMDVCDTNEYKQYEISNFAKNGQFAKHNSNYWLNKKYLGLGPSAHSFNKKSRQWNVANNVKYIKSINEGEIPFEEEILTEKQRYNEYIMISLRTNWGIHLDEIRETYGFAQFKAFCIAIAKHQQEGKITISGDQVLLTPAGILEADRIASDLFLL